MVLASADVRSEQVNASNLLKDDQAVSLRFFGSTSADLLTRELDESFRGVLEKNFVSESSK
jgi:hypothetical protein